MRRVVGALAAALVLGGCGSGAARPGVRAGCLTNVWTDVPLDEGKLARNVDRARAVLDARGIVPAGEFCRTFGETSIVTIEPARWNCAYGPDGRRRCWSGQTDVFTGVTLGRTWIGLAHELLHVRDQGSCAVGTAWHEGWTENGYDASDAEYVRIHEDPSPAWDREDPFLGGGRYDD